MTNCKHHTKGATSAHKKGVPINYFVCPPTRAGLRFFSFGVRRRQSERAQWSCREAKRVVANSLASPEPACRFADDFKKIAKLPLLCLQLPSGVWGI